MVDRTLDIIDITKTIVLFSLAVVMLIVALRANTLMTNLAEISEEFMISDTKLVIEGDKTKLNLPSFDMEVKE